MAPPARRRWRAWGGGPSARRRRVGAALRNIAARVRNREQAPDFGTTAPPAAERVGAHPERPQRAGERHAEAHLAQLPAAAVEALGAGRLGQRAGWQARRLASPSRGCVEGRGPPGGRPRSAPLGEVRLEVGKGAARHHASPRSRLTTGWSRLAIIRSPKASLSSSPHRQLRPLGLADRGGGDVDVVAAGRHVGLDPHPAPGRLEGRPLGRLVPRVAPAVRPGQRHRPEERPAAARDGEVQPDQLDLVGQRLEQGRRRRGRSRAPPPARSRPSRAGNASSGWTRTNSWRLGLRTGTATITRLTATASKLGLIRSAAGSNGSGRPDQHPGLDCWCFHVGIRLRM